MNFSKISKDKEVSTDLRHNVVVVPSLDLMFLGLVSVAMHGVTGKKKIQVVLMLDFN